MDTTQINHISLCAGYGGIDLGLKRILSNCVTIAYCEIELYPIANLVSKIESKEKQLDEAPIFTNLRTFNANPFRGMVDILSGGFPCQPFSSAGNKKSTDDPRHLFPDIERIILECEPRIIFLENVEGIISSKLGGEENTSVLKYVLESLEKMDYRATAGLFSAEEISAPHRRKRVFIAGVSNNDGERLIRKQESNSEKGSLEKQRWHNSDGCCSGKERLGNTEHDGSSATQKRGSVEKTSSRCLGNTHHGKHFEDKRGNEKEEGIQREHREEICGGLLRGANEQCGEEHGELGDTTSERSCRGGKDKCEQQPEVLGARSEPDRESEFPSKPGVPQQWWEFPRTIGETEEIITPLGCSTYGIASSLVHSNRANALRLLGNGVVPDCAAKAFVCLMHELNENYIEEV